jgi:hypothetical protein
VMIFAGGLPLTVDGTVVGAVGVSGGTGAQDQAVAEAAAAALSRARRRRAVMVGIPIVFSATERRMDEGCTLPASTASSRGACRTRSESARPMQSTAATPSASHAHAYPTSSTTIPTGTV